VRSRRGATALGVLGALGLALHAAGCAPRPLLERAIRARGGPLATTVRQVEAEVYKGFPGTWQWRTAFMQPERYAWTIVTVGEADHYLFDGTTVRSFVGEREVAVDSNPNAPLRSHARFTAVTNLDVLRLPSVQVAPLGSGALLQGTVSGLTAVFADDGARYDLGFDEHGLLVAAAGPVRLPPFGDGRVTARFADFRRVNGLLLPYRTSWSFEGQPLADERAVAVCPNDSELREDAFRDPDRIPTCP